MPPSPATARRTDTLALADAQRRDLYFFSLYRVFEAALLALVLFSPAGALIGEPRHPLLGKATTLVYLVAAAALLYWAQRRRALRGQVLVGTTLDILAASLAIHSLPLAAPGIALMLLFNVGAAALILPLRYGLGAGALAGVGVLAEFVWSTLFDADTGRPLAERVMFAVSYLSIAMLTYLLGRQMRESQALAARRGAEVADLAAINELIIRRMRTGVLLVDGEGRIRLANEAALLLLGESEGERDLTRVAPDLARRLRTWLRDGKPDDTPLRFGSEQIEVLPRFARLLAQGDTALVFLDDTSLVSRRAESMTLATLGRFSASLAHEIRNPLAAISYATQLLEESDDINAADRRLLQIIHQQCLRTNGIVESVLGLARRERASAEHVDLAAFARRFVDDYRQTLPPESGSVQVGGEPTPVAAMVDPRHLQQVLTVLVQNALTYGHLPTEPARVTLAVHASTGAPTIDVLDRGPGIPEGARGSLFRPFFTTSEHGTGLGLYIARELCRANEATLDYVSVAGGGSCFRITLPGPHTLLPA
ncbi:sensor histidine kinase [Cognatiluteimonas weifangensis]|uniref:histidine kinase n=1 Tax=Cognatiluteimonas weifangensis TaxID=2303539 RepID=A0A372DSG1_9GAMM|nr:HAMP domain-containing sensor histidine kinase [Luteimonas weifangensis]RFP62531.1 sensor histidine kinase [Luteimonas weifangensis]